MIISEIVMSDFIIKSVCQAKLTLYFPLMCDCPFNNFCILKAKSAKKTHFLLLLFQCKSHFLAWQIKLVNWLKSFCRRDQNARRVLENSLPRWQAIRHFPIKENLLHISTEIYSKSFVMNKSVSGKHSSQFVLYKIENYIWFIWYVLLYLCFMLF